MTLPTPHELDAGFRQKYGDPSTVGWSPRQRHDHGYSLPGDVYEAVVRRLVKPGCTWLDIGGGHQLLPENPALSRLLVRQCAALVAVDPSATVLKNPFATERVHARIEDYRPARQFDLVTLRMVAEHIDDPLGLTAALHRLVAPDGVVVILTVNRWSPLSLLARMVPFGWHHPIKRLFWGSEEEDTFPVVYKLNSRAALRRHLGAAGLVEAGFAHLDDLSTWGRFRVMSRVELAIWRVWRRLGIPYPENCLLGVYRKG